ncbi:MFS transporter [Roseibium sp. RKSG952]|uniref:MFS transporter n=1 Tax=Roseibium sp. RKSG952 TaxID=2529384 RepID=UPI0012BC1BC5|nr:MFS transporter [Roseibium sp. RKSG952]MTI01102.1 MFS transporter [Roseibium sp. RKSG952]
MSTVSISRFEGPLIQLLAAQIPADFSDWLDFVAIGVLLAFVWGVDPYVFALLAVAFGLPYLVVGPFAGVLVDRTGIKSTLVLSNLGRAAMTAGLAFAANWQMLLALVFLRGCVDAFYSPAKQSALQALTHEGNRLSANGISHAINQSSKIVAPALGGSLMILFDPENVFLLNAGISVLAAAMLLTLKPVPRPRQQEDGDGSVFSSLKEGYREVAGKPVLLSTLVLMAGGYFAIFFYDTLIAPLTKQLGFTEADLGYSLAAVGAGGVAGSLYFGMGKATEKPFRFVAAGLVFSGALTACLGAFDMFETSVSAIPFFMIFLLIGLFTAMATVPIRTVMQNQTDPNKMARVSSLSEAVNTVALLTAPFIGAFIAQATTIGVSFVIGGAISIALGFYALSIRER